MKDEGRQGRSQSDATGGNCARWGREKVRAALGLAVWEIDLAVTAGLLERGADRRFDPDEVRRAAEDLDAFQARLAAEHRLNATQAARRLGISTAQFKRVVVQAGTVPVAEEQVRKYGKVLTVRYYRAADVDGLADHVAADQVLREAATAVGRPEAARKAAATRARNKARAEQARHELDAVRTRALRGPAVAVVRYAAALAVGLPRSPGFLRAFAGDAALDALAALIDECRLRPGQRSEMLDEVLPQARVAANALARPAQIEQRSGIRPAVFEGRVDMIAGCMARAELEEVLAAPPMWLTEARAAAAAAEAEAAVRRERAAEEKAVLAAAEEATRLSDEAVAALFQLPVDVIAALRPRGRRWWHPQHVGGLLAAPPPWLRNEEAARAEAARRAARSARTRRKRTVRRQGWRRTWAQQLGVPLEQVPENCGKPTAKAVRAARAERPAWARARS
ncbi:hypothetical protein [Streptomyces montanisoli]|uniref:Uncharacterized protein n=1 Tax=Streptomyces montanisoli TaxID=2798581 RepID=A0A940MBK0_9ACTN|nr:hypothetical protein [Streptomyces montanisoli]MBP0459929.1 hypothetical protein [Streptomyces montanisoli]